MLQERNINIVQAQGVTVEFEDIVSHLTLNVGCNQKLKCRAMPGLVDVIGCRLLAGSSLSLEGQLLPQS
jgi:hypothetical protein